jgi:hypothetical protein
MVSIFRSSSHAHAPSGKLTILVPTYRFDARARHTLAATAALASDEVAVVIADNSEDRGKHEFLRMLRRLHPNVHVFCHERNIGALGNWEFLFRQAVLDYYLFIGDDDLCSPPYVESAMRLLDQHADATAAAGAFVMLTSTNQMMRANGARTEDSAYQRCVSFPIGGGNSLPNSMARRPAAQPFIDYARGHPLRASFFDWMMSYSLLAQGKYQVENQGLYLYDITNWEGGEACWKSNAKFYVAAGLPDAFTWLHELYWAVEFAHYFRGIHSPISDRRQSDDCARHFYLNRIHEFRRFLSNPANGAVAERLVSHRPHAVDAMRALAGNDDALQPAIFEWFYEILAAFDQECAVAYLDYASASVEAAAQHSAEAVGTAPG